MNPKPVKIKTLVFLEHPVFDFTQSEPGIYDVTANGLNCTPNFVKSNSFYFEAYCEALLKKLDALSKCDVQEFFEYQCALLKKPCEWLDCIESLIDSNFDYFPDETGRTKIQKLYMNIQLCRDKFRSKKKPLKGQLVNWADIMSEENTVKFDFNMVKFDLQKLDSYCAKKSYLIELKADYLQSENMMTVVSNKSFVNLIDIELDKIEKLNQIQPGSKAVKFDSVLTRPKVRINGNTNILTDIFYRLLYEFKPEGKPFIDGTPTDIANIIVENFASREGNDLSKNTVQTTLSPGKADKRPSCDRRFCLHHLMNSSLLVFCFYMPEIIDFIDDLDILF